MTAPVRLVVFDLDGTLVDSQGHIARAVVETSAALGLAPPPADAVPRVIGLSLERALAQLFPAADAATLAELDRVYRATFARWRAQPGQLEPLFAGSHGVLDQLEQAGYLLGIATGKSRRGVDRLLEGHGLSGRFVTIQTADTAPSKPDPGMLRQAMADTGAAPEATVMIGDTVYDIEMALAAGTAALGVAWGNHPAAELLDAGAHALVERMDHLMQAVGRLFGPHSPHERLSP
ncbi:MAG: HAD-IA family hydrolase [Rhodospirillaceae bacterium]|nr:HAD-IA family hydrolase [Rhodospirillaceae bacterium]